MTTAYDGTPTAETPLGEDQERQLRRYTSRVTVAMILLCNGVLALALWGSGVNLDLLIRSPEVFHQARHVCLRYAWQKVSGVPQPVRICSEWIDLSDTSGQPHVLSREIEVLQGADGKLYFDYGARMGYQVFLVGAVIVLVIAAGVKLERWLIARYRTRLAWHNRTSK
ncbi:MAG: hypothetical protein ACREI3_02070 [Nitrospirales bacterium]